MSKYKVRQLTLLQSHGVQVPILAAGFSELQAWGFLIAKFPLVFFPQFFLLWFLLKFISTVFQNSNRHRNCIDGAARAELLLLLTFGSSGR